ncbi:hypothetical protein AG1IA_10123 [Rhizoctonia solani AG-1 IA]|uniref:Uncharacterized protein n=1 Tax=Thanatephorus cucumeris (strain AG1-IA) TaxID=983506 RepID=L8WGL1_THACA|nr:hypothetical protein AG1IA_10123 [Rhizoctonia solani AG-1 IA]
MWGARGFQVGYRTRGLGGVAEPRT